MADVVFNFIGNTRNLSRSIDSVNRKFRFMKAGMAGAAIAIGAAVAAMVGTTVQSFSKFDSAITQSQAIMRGLTEDQSRRMKDLALEMSKAFTFSAAEIGKAFYFLTSAGFDVEQSLGSLKPVLQFAQAGMFDLSSATDLLTDAQSALGLTVDDVAQNTKSMIKVSDVLVRANQLANASVEQFSQALTTKAAAAAKIAGLQFESLVSALAVFADQGTKAEEAGTRMNIVLREMQTKSRTSAEQWKKLGIEVWDTQGNMRDLHLIIGDMDKAFAGFTAQQKKAALASLGFQDRSVIAVQMMLGNTDKMKGYLDSLLDATGATETVSDKQLQSFQAKMTILKNRLTVVGIQIGEVLAPAIETLARKFVEFTENVGPHVKNVIDWFKDAIEVVRNLWAAFKESPVPKQTVDKIIELFNTVRDYAGVGSKNDSNTQRIISGGKQIGEYFTTGVGGQIGKSVGKFVGDSVAATIDYIKNHEVLQNLNWGKSLEDDLKSVATIFSRLGTMAWDFSSSTAESISKTKDWKLVSDIFKGAWEDISSVFGTVVEYGKEIWESMKRFANDLDLSDALEALKALGAIITGVVLFAITLLGNAVRHLSGPILGILFSKFDIGLKVISTAFNIIIDLFLAIIALVTGDFSGAWDHVKQIFTSLKELLQTVFDNAISIFKDLGGLLLGVAKTIADSIIEFLGIAFDITPAEILGFFMDIGDWIASIGSMVKESIVALAQNLWTAFKFVWNLPEFLTSLVLDTIKGLGSKYIEFSTLFSNAIINILKTAGIYILDAVKDLGKSIWNGIVAGFREVVNVKGLINDAFGLAGGLISKVPGFATGGYVNKPTLAVIGEREPEYVIPESKMGSMGRASVNIENFNAITNATPQEIAEELRFLFLGYGA